MKKVLSFLKICFVTEYGILSNTVKRIKEMKRRTGCSETGMTYRLYNCLYKQSKVKIGYRYRFFFRQTQRFSLGSEYLDTAMSSDHFLGYEELGEFAAETTE